MKVLQRSAVFAAVALVVVMTGTAANAQDFNTNKRTFFTFSSPVEVPGATLEPGKYMFQLADLQSNRHVVQIFNEDGSKLIVTALTIPDQRMEATGEPEIKFLETPAGAPAAIKVWYYPGDLIGDEFIYPKEQAIRIAKATSTTVLSSDTITGSGIPDMKAETTARIDASGAAVSEQTATAPPRAETVTTPPPPPTPTAVGTSGRTELPRTASNTPLVGLIGVLSIVGALSIRRFARNRA